MRSTTTRGYYGARARRGLGRLGATPEQALLATLFVAVTLMVVGIAEAPSGPGAVARRLRAMVGPAESEVPMLLRRSGAGRAIARYVDRSAAGKDKDRSTIRRQLVQAGFLSPHAVGLYYAARIGLAVALPLLGTPAYMLAMGGRPALSLLVSAGLLGLGFLLPNLVVTRRAASRQRSFRLAFPDALDLLLVCVEAGLSLNAALTRVSRELEKGYPLLARELQIATLEIQAGVPRDAALRSMAERIGPDEVGSFVSLVIQSEAMGSSIAQTLRVYSEEMRRNRLLLAEEKAAKVPVKMVFPLVFFILSSFMIVIMAPAIIGIQRNLLPALAGN